MSPGELADILRWYADMGVDVALDEAPHDRFAEAAAAAKARRDAPLPPPRRERRGEPPTVAAAAEAPASFSAPEPAAPAAPPVAPSPFPPRAPRPPAAALSADQAVISARERAAAAGSLDDLRRLLAEFEGCGLKATATQLVFADGNPEARIMFVGEAPGADEDRMGLPFVGRAGQLLDRMLAAIGLDRTNAYIANVVPWRPPGNRTPTPQETSVCLPFMRRQIELVGPDLLVCLGAASASTLLGLKDGILRTRGRWYDYEIASGDRGTRTIPAMATLHPAYLLRQPSQKRLAWRDLRLVKKALDALAER